MSLISRSVTACKQPHPDPQTTAVLHPSSGSWLFLILMPKFEIRAIHLWQAVENLVCQRTGRREHDFASSRHEASSPPRMNIRPGDCYGSDSFSMEDQKWP
jgi:hypothetical protein